MLLQLLLVAIELGMRQFSSKLPPQALLVAIELGMRQYSSKLPPQALASIDIGC
jgi:hypothetical protein